MVFANARARFTVDHVYQFFSQFGEILRVASFEREGIYLYISIDMDLSICISMYLSNLYVYVSVSLIGTPHAFVQFADSAAAKQCRDVCIS